MTVAVFPADRGGCGHYRILYPAQALQDQGHDVVVIDDDTLPYYVDPDGLEPPRLFLDADIAVIQRIVTEQGARFAHALKDHGHTLVVDIDDDLDALHPDHPYRSEVDGSTEGSHGHWLHECCRIADVVTVTTPALARRYGYGKAVILPNMVPAAHLEVRSRRTGRHTVPPLVGWTGRPLSHIDDARVMGPRLGRMLAARGAQFVAWGRTAPEAWRQAAIPAGARRRVPYRDLGRGYLQDVAKLDVGLVPLADSPFNRAKSWLKGLEYAALGVPFVASPLPQYRELAERGAGLLAATPAEWEAQVGRLLSDATLRADLALSGSQVARGLTYEEHAHRWWAAWTGEATMEAAA